MVKKNKRLLWGCADMDSVKPLNYNLSLFDLKFGGDWGYNGTVRIDAAVQKASKEIVVNSKELDIKSARLHSLESNCTSRSCRKLSSEQNEKLIEGSFIQQRNGRLPRSISIPQMSERLSASRKRYPLSSTQS